MRRFAAFDHDLLAGLIAGLRVYRMCRENGRDERSIIVLGASRTSFFRVLNHVSKGPLDLSRRDNGTQPGILTPGADRRTIRPERAVDANVSDDATNETSGTVSLPPLQGGPSIWRFLGLKPQARSSHPFGINPKPARGPSPMHPLQAECNPSHCRMSFIFVAVCTIVRLS